MMLPNPAGAQPIRAPAQGQISDHLQASQMAHAAAQRAAVSRVLARSGAGAPPAMGPKPPSANSFKHHVIAAAAQQGAPGASIGDVHAAIDKATAAGAFHPDQGAALKAHDGPLLGAPGANTIATLGSTLANMKAPSPNARPF